MSRVLVRWAACSAALGIGGALFGGCAGPGPEHEPPPPLSPWRWVPGETFVHVETRETRRTEEMLGAARDLVAGGRLHEAAILFHLVIVHSRVDDHVASALLDQARLLAALQHWSDAFELTRKLLERHPNTPQGRAAQSLLFEIARSAILQGTRKKFLLIGYSSDAPGIALMMRALAEFRQVPGAAEHALWLAEYLLESGEAARAEEQCRFILKEYDLKDGGAYAYPKILSGALLVQGRAHLRRYNGRPYDGAPLKDADKAFHRILEEFPDSEAAGPAREHRKEIAESLARKMLDAARFYDGRGREEAAALYFMHIVRDYPETSAAAAARDRLEEIRPSQEPSPVGPEAPPPKEP